MDRDSCSLKDNRKFSPVRLAPFAQESPATVPPARALFDNCQTDTVPAHCRRLREERRGSRDPVWSASRTGLRSIGLRVMTIDVGYFANPEYPLGSSLTAAVAEQRAVV